MTTRRRHSGTVARWHGGIAVVALVAAACAVSQQQEVQLGADYSAQIEKELPIIRDGQVNSYIASLGNSLARVADTRGLTW